MGLSAGGLSMGGGLICGSQKRASETTDIIRQNENLYLKIWRKRIVLFVCLLIKENLYLKSCLSGSNIGKNRNQRVRSYGIAYVRGRELIRGVTQVLRKRRAYLRGPYTRGAL